MRMELCSGGAAGCAGDAGPSPGVSPTNGTSGSRKGVGKSA